MPNALLDNYVARYKAATDAAAVIQDRAAKDGTAGRDLTEAEFTEVEVFARTAAELAPKITALATAEKRNREVADAAASVALAEQAAGTGTDAGAAAGAEGDGQSRAQNAGTGARTGNAQTQDRDPGHYRRGGERSFFADLVRAKEQDDGDARTRLHEHNRALSNATNGAGLVPPKWLVEEYEKLARQGRMLSAAVRKIPLGADPRPISLPKQTAGTDSVVAEQSAENTHPSETDAYNSNVDLVVPKPTSGIQIVSRQMIDMDDPAIDLLIYGDLLAVYDRKVEDKVCTVVVAAAGAANTTFATEAAFVGTSPAQPASDAMIDAAFAVWDARKLPADLVAMRVNRWGKFNKLRDSAGRKLYPTSDAGPMNVDGVGAVNAAGNIEGLAVIPTDGLGIGGATYPENIIVMRASDTILFEGDLLRFRYEEVAGPESIKLGIWAYTAAITRQATKSVRRVQVTAA